MLKKLRNKKTENAKPENQKYREDKEAPEFQETGEEKVPEKREDRTNRDIMRITYIFVGLFVLLLGYFSYFIAMDSDEVINNSYNQRQDLLAKQVTRGNIMSANGEILAQTITDGEGKETRVYPFGSMFVHVVGRFSKGRTGIEASDNFHLLTSNVNPVRMILNELSGKKNVGDNVVTTLDTDIQETAYNALGSNKGAVVVLEPSTGKILAMVSKPDYDPNKIDELWDEMVDKDNNSSALINRATQGLYPPGSTFKILTALEYIRENPDYEKYSYTCDGKITIDDITINCYNNKKHGKEDLKKSFAKSCNSSFANLGTTLNLASFHKLCETFLFNTALPTNLVYNQSSFVLNSDSPKKEIPQTAIGQGKTQITPLHNALITAAVANGGVLMKPYVVDHIESAGGKTIKKYLPEIYGTLMTPSESQILTSFMTTVVEDGTASALKGKSYTVAGKTGSAEYREGKPAHAWFVGFAPAEDPQIAVSIVVESVGTGSDYAVPIASKIFDTYFKKKR